MSSRRGARLLFPFLFGGTFIEVINVRETERNPSKFPFLFVGTFIEVKNTPKNSKRTAWISLPFRRDFH